MFRGLLGGLVWGGVLGAGILAVLSLLFPLSGTRPTEPMPVVENGTAAPGAGQIEPPPAEAEAEEPAAEEQPAQPAEPAAEPSDEATDEEQDQSTNAPSEAAPTETAPTEPVVDTAAVAPEPSAEPAPAVEAAAPEPSPTPPAAVTEAPSVAVAEPQVAPAEPTLPQNQTGASAPTPAVSPAAPQAPTEAEATVSAEATLPAPLPEPEAEPEPVAEPVAEAPVEVPAETTAEAPAATQPEEAAEPQAEALPQVVADTTPPAADAVPETATEVEGTEAADAMPADAETPPVVTTDAPIGIGRPAGTLADGAAGFGNRATNVRVNRLPTIGAGAEEAPAEDAATETEAVAEAESPALRRYAAPFENPAGLPLMSVVLIDIGEGEGGLGGPALDAIPFPVTLAVPASRSDAAQAAAAHRAAGREVVIVADALPALASPSDTEVAFEAFRSAMPEAVAVLAPPQGGFQGNRARSEQVVAILAARGQGLLTMEQGLNSAEQIAARDGLPSARVFRDLDAEGTDQQAVRRTLDRALLRAGQDGQVVLIARTRPETVATLVGWALEGGAEGVAMAPVSVILSSE